MQSPYYKLYHQQPDYTNLKVFGCICFPWQPPLHTNKLQPKAPQCIFIGYSPIHKGYRCYNPQTRKIITSRHVVFHEIPSPSTIPASTLPSSPIPHHTPSGLLLPSPYPNNPPLQPTSSHSPPITTTEPLPASPTSSSPDNPTPPHNQHPMLTRLKASISKPKLIPNFLHLTVNSDPTTYHQAIKQPCWTEAMNQEFQALQHQCTWTLVPPPASANVLGCKWTYKTKRHSDWSISRHKARLVAQGYTQEYGLDYTETFSPVARMATIRLLLTVASHHNWDVLQFDVSNAFLHGHLDDLIYMRQPPGFQDPRQPHHVCKLNKSIYGLK